MGLTGRRIVLIEDDEIMGASLAQRLELEGAEVVWRRQALRGLHAVRTPPAPIDAVVCDIRLRDGDGEAIFATLSDGAAPPPFLFITAHGGAEQAVRLLRAGAGDYLVKPFPMALFLERLSRLMPPRPADAAASLLGVSAAARAVEAQVTQAAAGTGPVLIEGPRGSGRARLAARLHALSDRRAAPLATAALSRAADPAAALAAALATVGDGVLHLEGLGKLDPAGQQRLLGALRAGAEFRVVASCGLRIGEKVAAGAFSEPLYWLLAANRVVVPPLAARPEDALWLMRRLFEPFNARRAAPLAGISALAEEAARAHGWPGEGRELRARLARGVAMAAGEMLGPVDLFPERASTVEAFPSLAEARDAAERAHIRAALERANGQPTEAARLLRISRTTLWEKMQKLGM